MRKYTPVIVLFILILSFITVVSATDVNQTEELTDNTIISQESAVTTTDVASEKSITKKSEINEKKTSNENVTDEGDDCCSAIIQGNGVDSTISFRRDSKSAVTLNVTHNSSYIKQAKGSGSYFFHVIISKNGWIVGNGGTDANTTSLEIEKNAIQMIEKNTITKSNFNNIINLKLTSSKGHFVIKAPNGTYALFINNNGTSYNETGTLKAGYCLVVPNDPAYFKKGKYQNLSGNAYVITSSRLLAAKDKYGVERRDILTYSYKRNGTKVNVKIYACNDDGRFVNKSTGKYVDNIRTNTKFYSTTQIPGLETWLLIDDVNFTSKYNTTIKSKNINVKTENITLTATVKDEYNKAVNEGFVSFLFDNRTIKDSKGKVIYVNVTNGTASINHTISNFWKKTNHTYYARYYGNSLYEANLGNVAKVTETNVINLTSTHANVTRFGTNLTIKAFVKYNADKSPVNVGHVLFKINGKTIRNPDNSTLTVNVKKGKATFNLDLDERYSAKPYKVTVVYGYGAFREVYNTTVNIHKVPTNVTNTTVSVDNNTVHVTGNFVDDNEVSVPYNSYLSLKIDGKTIKNSLNKTMTFNITDGVIDFTFNLTRTYKKGKHNLTLVIPELRETLGVRINTTMTIVKKSTP